MARNGTLNDVLQWLEGAPPRTQLDAEALVEMLRPLVESPAAPVEDTATEPPAISWRERLWLVPAETRLGREEVCEAFNRPKSWLYRHTSGKTIPFRKLDGELYFLAGELRAWARDREEVVTAGRMESTAAERALRFVPRAGRDD